MKGWKKGAIFGAIWGIVGTPLYLLFGLMWGEKSFPQSIENVLFFSIHLPARTLYKLFGYYDLSQDYERDAILFFGSNFVGWIIIGAIIGYLYMKK